MNVPSVTSEAEPEVPYLIVSTTPDEATARAIAATLVEERHAACVNVLPGATSVYAWEGRIETDPECLMFVKSAGAAVEACTRRIAELHPYELPEVVAVRIDAGLTGYLDWVRDTTGPARDAS